MALQDVWQLTTHSSYSLTCILRWTLVPAIWPSYIYRSPYIHNGNYMTWSLNPVVWHATTLWGSHHLIQAPIIQAEMQPALHEYMTPTREDPHGTWSARWIHHSPTTGLTLFPTQHTPAISQHSHYHWAYTRRHMSTSSYDGEKSCSESWGDREIESQVTKREAQTYMRLVG